MIDKRELVEKLFRKKCEIKGIRFSGVEQIFPFDIESALSPYWSQELGRLLNPLPDLHSILEDLKAMLKFLESWLHFSIAQILPKIIPNHIKDCELIKLLI